jgi:hypothetical protein
MLLSFETTANDGGKLRPGICFIPSEVFCFGSLEFIAHQMGDLRLFDIGEAPDAIFVGVTIAGEPLLHDVLTEMTDEGESTSDDRDEPPVP